jgi:hypothetical protein
MSTMLVVMPTATRYHEGGKYVRTILCSSVGDLSSVSAARGILSSFQLSVKASGNWPSGVRSMFSTALDLLGCSITIATPPMACTHCSTCPPFLRSCPDAATVTASNIQTPRSKGYSAASPNLVRMTLPYSISVQHTSSLLVIPCLQLNTHKQG